MGMTFRIAVPNVMTAILLVEEFEFFPPDEASRGKKAEYRRSQIQLNDGPYPEGRQRRILRLSSIYGFRVAM